MSGDAPAAGGDGELDFGMKKKKKKKKVVLDGAEGDEGEPDFSGKEKKSKGKKKVESDDAGEAVFSYQTLLDRVFEEYMASKSENTRIKVEPPNVARDGTRKTVFVNFARICKQLNRTTDHMNMFIMAELGTTGSMDGSSRMVIKGRYYPKQIEGIVRKYINEYVACAMCHSPNTILHKDQQTRLTFVKCNACGASRSVATVKSGFSAVLKGDRKKARMASS